MTVTTAVKKVSEMSGNFVKVYVMDYIAKRRYFGSSEITGWLLEDQDGVTEIYPLHQHAENELGENIDEPVIFLNEKYEGKEKDKQMWKMIKEVKLQHYTKENNDILEQVKPFIS